MPIQLEELLSSSRVFWKHNRSSISLSAALDLLHSRVYESKEGSRDEIIMLFSAQQAII